MAKLGSLVGERLRKLGRQFRRPRIVIERRLRICSPGMLGEGDETDWSTDLEDPAATAFREKYANLRCLDRCPYSRYDWDVHVRHILIEEREADG